MRKTLILLTTVLLLMGAMATGASAATVSSIALNKASFTQEVGQSYTLKATIKPQSAADTAIKWTSSDSKIATVSKKGVVKGIAVGKVTIKATAGTQTATCTVRIKEKVVDHAKRDELAQKLGLIKGTAAEIDATDIGGNAVTLSKLKGEVVVINLLATWCGPCMNELPDFQKLYAEKAAKFIGVGIGGESTATLQAMARSMGLTFPIINDTDDAIWWAYSTSNSIPQTFVVDSQGVLRYSRVGSTTYSNMKKIIDDVRSLDKY